MLSVPFPPEGPAQGSAHSSHCWIGQLLPMGAASLSDRRVPPATWRRVLGPSGCQGSGARRGGLVQGSVCADDEDGDSAHSPSQGHCPCLAFPENASLFWEGSTTSIFTKENRGLGRVAGQQQSWLCGGPRPLLELCSLVPPPSTSSHQPWSGLVKGSCANTASLGFWCPGDGSLPWGGPQGLVGVGEVATWGLG